MSDKSTEQTRTGPGRTKVWMSTVGRPVDPQDAKISVFDRGFLYGDSIYETMRTAGGHPVELSRHLQRLHSSAAGIGLTLSFDDAHIADAIAQTHRATGNAESYVRAMVTRGAGPIMLDPRKSEDSTLVIAVQPLVVPTAEQYARGVSAVLVDVVKSGGSGIDPRIKSGNYLANIMALRQAFAAGGDDAIMRGEDGDISEGATSNLFVVSDGAVVTPHLAAGLLAGITRSVVCELAADLGLPLSERRVDPETLARADEMFLTSSVRGIMPMTRLDGRPVGDGTAGPVTLRLIARYAQYIDAWARGESGLHA